MTFIHAEYVMMPYRGVLTTDKWVGAKRADASVETLPDDSDLPEWQEYLAEGGTIDPYTEASPLPPANPSPSTPGPPMPGPVLSRLDPVSMPADCAPFEMMCWGENFSFNTIVLFNGEKMPSMFVNRSQVLVSLSGGPWRQPGAYPVRIVTTDQNITNTTTEELTFTFEGAKEDQ